VSDEAADFPVGHADERELFLDWLGFLRRAVIRKLGGLDDEQARWRPHGRLISVLGIVNHLTWVERRWIEGGIGGATVGRDEAELHPGRQRRSASRPSLRRSRSQSGRIGARPLSIATIC
jgi:uncharacterized damage-inducible protein DinB